MRTLSKSALLILFISSSAWGHANLVSPVPRTNDMGLKVGPCGGKPRGTSPTVVTGGQALTVQWQETINHPGKFLVSLSMANDTGFDQNLLATVVDNKDTTNDLPHVFTAQVQIPDVNCDTCTLQLIQSMEENPSAPTYYYSCADLKIVATTTPPTAGGTPTPGGGDNSPQSTGNSSSATATGTQKFGGGCGLIASAFPGDSGDGTGGSAGMSMKLGLVFLMPILVGLLLRRRGSQQLL